MKQAYTFQEIKRKFGITKKKAINLMDDWKDNGVRLISTTDKFYTKIANLNS